MMTECICPISRFVLSATRSFVGVVLLGIATLAGAAIQLTLENSFIEQYKNLATIDATCVVDYSEGKPNPGSQGGDMHSTVRCPDEIALPLAAGIMNAKEHLDAIALAKEAESHRSKVRIKGAWRIWNEYRGGQAFKQGGRVNPAENTKPDHVFEIHPISELDKFDLRTSFKPIPGYTARAAEDAFRRYENTPAQIIPGKGVTTIISSGVGYNYVEFQMELYEKPFPVSDGSFAFANVRDWQGELLLRIKRMVFVKDSPPEIAVRDKKRGDCLRVLGIPRLHLALVSWRSKNAKSNPGALTWNLPYEIIVVGVYDSACQHVNPPLAAPLGHRIDAATAVEVGMVNVTVPRL